uniref:Uncharacterized protein n=1 Tax=Heliothis virescens TaxID=7102 RepID=A0A2A4J765_HELVI
MSPVAIEEVSNYEVMDMQFEQMVHVSPVPGTSPETIIPETMPLQETLSQLQSSTQETGSSDNGTVCQNGRTAGRTKIYNNPSIFSIVRTTWQYGTSYQLWLMQNQT